MHVAFHWDFIFIKSTPSVTSSCAAEIMSVDDINYRILIPCTVSRPMWVNGNLSELYSLNQNNLHDWNGWLKIIRRRFHVHSGESRIQYEMTRIDFFHEPQNSQSIFRAHTYKWITKNVVDLHSVAQRLDFCRCIEFFHWPISCGQSHSIHLICQCYYRNIIMNTLRPIDNTIAAKTTQCFSQAVAYFRVFVAVRDWTQSCIESD